jgi:hypothetical protein
MDALKDIYLAVWWTVSAWPKKVKKRLSGIGEAVRDWYPSRGPSSDCSLVGLFSQMAIPATSLGLSFSGSASLGL